MKEEVNKIWLEKFILNNPFDFKNGIINHCRQMDKLDVYEWIAEDELKINNLQSQLKAKEEENKRYRELGFKYLNDQNSKLKEVIKEAREYVEKYDVFKEFYFPLMKRDVENQIKSSIKYEFDTSIKKNLLEILSKGENK